MSSQPARRRGTEWLALLCAMAVLVGGVVAFDRGESTAEQVVVADRTPATPIPPTPEPTAPPTHHHEAELADVVDIGVPVPRSAPNTAPASADVSRPPPSEELKVLGKIELPRIGMTQTLYEGVELSILKQGPGLWPGRGVPGEPRGNAVVAGHRTTHTRPFRHIDELREGDEIIFHMNNGRFVYHVTEYFSVEEKSGGWIVGDSTDPITTLFACHPPGSRRYRYVVRGALDAPATPPPTPRPTPSPTPTPRRGLLPPIFN